MKKRIFTIIQLAALIILHITAFSILYSFDKKQEDIIKQDFPEIRQELSSQNKEYAEITKGGCYIQYDIKMAVIWYIIEESDNGKYYLPAKYRFKNFDEYEFIEKCETKLSGINDIVYVECFGGYILLINNENCTGYETINNDGTTYRVDIENDEYPYIDFIYDISSCRFFIIP